MGMAMVIVMAMVPNQYPLTHHENTPPQITTRFIIEFINYEVDDGDGDGDSDGDGDGEGEGEGD